MATKSPTKKATKKVALKKEEKKEYHVVVKLNDQVFEFDTNDIKEAILSTKQDFLRTKVLIYVTKDNKTLDRMYYLYQGKRLFEDKYAMDAFIKNLIF